MTDTTEQTLPTTIVKRVKKKQRQFFSMEHWKDEMIARKHIKSSFEDMRMREKDAGFKTQLKKHRQEDGTQTYCLFFSEEEVDKNGNVKVIWNAGNYIAVHFDPSRKFPGGRKKKGK